MSIIDVSEHEGRVDTVYSQTPLKSGLNKESRKQVVSRESVVSQEATVPYRAVFS